MTRAYIDTHRWTIILWSILAMTIFPAHARAAVSPQAVNLALTFLAPWNGGVKPCDPDLHIDYVQFSDPAVIGYAPTFETGIPSCLIEVRVDIGEWSVPSQCATIAHEVGHAWFLWAHVDDPTNIMYPFQVIPGGCRARTRQQASRRRLHHRSHRSHPKAVLPVQP